MVGVAGVDGERCQPAVDRIKLRTLQIEHGRFHLIGGSLGYEFFDERNCIQNFYESCCP